MQYLAALLALTAASFATLSVAAPYCTGQGAGNCNIVYTCSSEIASDNVDCSMTLFNHKCAVIGGTWNSPNPGDVLDSQLPYTIDLNYANGLYTHDIGFNFRYGAGKYGSGITNCHTSSCSSGLVACEFAVCSFPCTG